MIKLISLCLSLFIITLCSSKLANAHYSHTHTAPWQACENMHKTEQCSYTNGDGDLFKGTCQLFDEVLMCVRNQPIIHVEDLAKDAQSTNKKTHHHETLSENGVH